MRETRTRKLASFRGVIFPVFVKALGKVKAHAWRSCRIVPAERNPRKLRILRLAERQGFEPWIPCGIHAFQACAFSHSAISPRFRDAPRPRAAGTARATSNLSRVSSPPRPSYNDPSPCPPKVKCRTPKPRRQNPRRLNFSSPKINSPQSRSSSSTSTPRASAKNSAPSSPSPSPSSSPNSAG